MASGTDAVDPTDLASADLRAVMNLERLEVATEEAHRAVLRHASAHPDLRDDWQRYDGLRAKLDRVKRAIRESGA